MRILDKLFGSSKPSFTPKQQESIDATIKAAKAVMEKNPKDTLNSSDLGITATNFMHTGLFSTTDEARRASEFVIKTLGIQSHIETIEETSTKPVPSPAPEVDFDKEYNGFTLVIDDGVQ